MYDLTRVPEGVISPVDDVVRELVTKTGLAPQALMLVGAFARDLHHAAYGHEQLPLRRTTDLDMAISLATWEPFDKARNEFPPLGASGIRCRIAGWPVDCVPFGAVEEPDGEATPRSRGESLSVFGFRSIYAGSSPFTLPSGHPIMVPSPAGYAAVKLCAWLDRVPGCEYKDATDLAAAAYWYANDSGVVDRLYDTKAGYEILEGHDFDVDCAAAALLGLDALGALSRAEQDDLRMRMAGTDAELFTRYFVAPDAGGEVVTRPDLPRRREIAAALLSTCGMIG
ncbi:hypothetical protein [Falsarthrobacter nasiphocae]|uniref:Nucleotidyltransferase n=1 Tax=Falsarthrobacter nasiphocae TaxID=189863 RepID=A0AAE4C6X3_9MICC|nr:hypothetical protein [Falsarthrobacter nasiphocae]MDR6891894.1 putative nucleotidyltransferase [Falsarthrobacter nasiphocae]